MSSPRKVPTHTNNHFTPTPETKPKDDKSKELDRPEHHRLHSELEHKREAKHERMPTTYPKLQSESSMFSKKEKKVINSDELYTQTWGECFRSLFCCSK